jgi:hypothetical protein
MTTPYTTPDVLMDAVDKKVDDSNGRLTRLILAVSQALDRICNRPDGFVAADTATARLFVGTSSGILRIDENVGVTALGVKANSTDPTYVTWDAGDYLAFGGDMAYPDFNRTPYTGLMAAPGSGLIFTGFFGGDEIAWESGRIGLGMSRYYSRGQIRTPTVQVTARWGYADEVPPLIEEACIIQASRLWKRGQSAFADTLVAGEIGQMLFRVKIDQDLKLLLENGRMIRPAIG